MPRCQTKTWGNSEWGRGPRECSDLHDTNALSTCPSNTHLESQTTGSLPDVDVAVAHATLSLNDLIGTAWGTSKKCWIGSPVAIAYVGAPWAMKHTLHQVLAEGSLCAMSSPMARECLTTIQLGTSCEFPFTIDIYIYIIQRYRYHKHLWNIKNLA